MCSSFILKGVLNPKFRLFSSELKKKKFLVILACYKLYQYADRIE